MPTTNQPSTGPKARKQNIMTTKTTATLAEFIESDEGARFLSSAEYGLADTRSNDIGDHLLSEFERAADRLDAEYEVLFSAREIADNFQRAADDIRGFIHGYFKQSGAIERAESAVSEFCRNPTSATYAGLLKAAQVMEGHDVPMPVSLARRIRPFIRYGRMPANRIASRTSITLQRTISAKS